MRDSIPPRSLVLFALGSISLWGACVFPGGLVLLLRLRLGLRGAVLLLLLARVFAGLSLALLRGGLLGLLGQSIGLLGGRGAGLAAAIRIALNDANSRGRGGIGLVHLLDGSGRERAAGGAV